MPSAPSRSIQSSGRAYETKGMALWRSGRPLDALSAFQRALRFDPVECRARWSGWVRSCWTPAAPTKRSTHFASRSAPKSHARRRVRRHRAGDGAAPPVRRCGERACSQRGDDRSGANPRIGAGAGRLEAARSTARLHGNEHSRRGARVSVGLRRASSSKPGCWHRRMWVAGDARRPRRRAPPAAPAPRGSKKSPRRAASRGRTSRATDALSPAGDHGRRRRALRHGQRRRPRSVSRPERQRSRSRREGSVQPALSQSRRRHVRGRDRRKRHRRRGLRHGRRRRRLRQRRRHRPVRHQRRPECPAAKRRRRPLHRRDGRGRRRRAGLEHQRRVLRRRCGRRPRSLRAALHQLERSAASCSASA